MTIHTVISKSCERQLWVLCQLESHRLCFPRCILVGITSDPLTQFACAFSALIHDVDHVGVSNAQLVKEGVPIAAKYKGRSVAEQNSLDLSWDLLMRPKYNKLRAYLLPTQNEMVRFRQVSAAIRLNHPKRNCANTCYGPSTAGGQCSDEH